MFLNILDKPFHLEHKLNKIFNRDSVKVSYRCTKNIEHIIKNHNGKLSEGYIEKSAESSCNCKEKNMSIKRKLFNKNIVYMATETSTSSYVGMTRNNFKTRYYNHIKSFKISATKMKPNYRSIYGNLKKRKSSTPSRGKSRVNLTPANDCPDYITCASRRMWRYYSAK